MIRTKMAKIAALTVGMTFVFGLAANTASAQTVADIQAQINALMAQLAALSGGSTVSGSFTQDLTVGSTGSQVVALQQMLVAQGHLSMPAGVAMGYFGSLTKAAVARWQASVGISPAAGYFGPISRARVNGMGGTVPGTTVGGSTSGGVITTPGVEGTLTVSKNPSPASGVKVYEGDTKKAVLGIKLEAKTSDIKVERIKLDLDETGNTATADSAFYNKVASRIYVMDGSTVLGSADLNSSTVVDESGEISITISGFGYVVPKDSTRVLTIAVDAKSSWDAAYDGDTWTVGVATDGVRGVDGAGVNQYGPSASGAFLNTFTSEGELAESATLAIATASDSPVTGQNIASQGSGENELDGLTVLKFTARAEKDDVTITDAVVSITRGGAGVATATTAYLYDGSTLVGSATVAGTSATAMSATFSDIDYLVPVNTTKTLTVKLDIDSAAAAADTFLASVAATTGITAERSTGDAVSETGSATGETQYVRNAGPIFTLKSANVTYTPAQGGVSAATSTAKATFVIGITAVGGDIVFGTQSASSTFNIATFKGSTKTVFVNGSTTNFVIPSSGVITTGLLSTDAFKLAENQSVDVTVDVIFPGRLTTGALLSTDAYSWGVQSILWSNSASPYSLQESNFMDNKTSWRTSSITLP
ncbi:peptidoglycan-binding protein [Candidatus Parcubacteria bacterium]|nr:peptidoglycan-binding protein [Candidatus Parcubacteria bacterium]